jgi:hypothetical protein
MHFSSPSGHRLSWWWPWNRGAVGRLSSGYITVSTFLNISRKVTPNPLTGARKSGTRELPGEGSPVNADATVVRQTGRSHQERRHRLAGIAADRFLRRRVSSSRTCGATLNTSLSPPGPEGPRLFGHGSHQEHHISAVSHRTVLKSEATTNCVISITRDAACGSDKTAESTPAESTPAELHLSLSCTQEAKSDLNSSDQTEMTNSQDTTGMT